MIFYPVFHYFFIAGTSLSIDFKDVIQSGTEKAKVITDFKYLNYESLPIVLNNIINIKDININLKYHNSRKKLTYNILKYIKDLKMIKIV